MVRHRCLNCTASAVADNSSHTMIFDFLNVLCKVQEGGDVC